VRGFPKQAFGHVEVPRHDLLQATREFPRLARLPDQSWPELIHVELGDHIQASRMVRVCSKRRYAAPMVAYRGYVCLELRHCCGEPLLPNSDAPAAGRKNFALGPFLSRLLAEVGGPRFELRSSLDGRPLVPYQALVPARDWLELWGALEGPLKQLHEAYRNGKAHHQRAVEYGIQATESSRHALKSPDLDFGAVTRFTKVDLSGATSME